MLTLRALHHTGYVVGQLEETERRFATLGYQRRSDDVEDPHHDARIVFLARAGHLVGEPLLELIQPLSAKSPVYHHRETARLSIHHQCFSVESLDAALEDARHERFVQTTPIVEAPAIARCRICFFYSPATGLFELVERPPF